MQLTEKRSTDCRQSKPAIATRGDGSKILSGYAAVFYDGSPATEFELYDGAVERIAPTAFDRAIRERHDVRGLFNHDADNLLGRTSSGTLRLSVDAIGLRYEIDLDARDPDHARVLAKLERGDLTGSSFAFRPTMVRWEEQPGGSIRWIEDLDLFDVGPVTWPAYSASTADVRGVDVDALEAERQRFVDAQRVAYVENLLRRWKQLVAEEQLEAEENDRDRKLAWMKSL